MPSYAETKATTMTQPPMIPGHLFSIAIGYYYANGNANGPLIGFDMGKLDFQIGYNFQSKGMLMGIGWKFLQF